MECNRIETFNGDNNWRSTEMDDSPIFGVKFDKTIVDTKILEGDLDYALEDKGLKYYRQGNCANRI